MPKVTIPIYADDDFERLADLRTEVSIAERRLETARADAEESRGSVRREGDDEVDSVLEAKESLASARAAFNEAVDEAAERAESWVLKPIGHGAFRELLKAHPPRMIAEGEGEVTHPEDSGWDLNTETFPIALLLYVDPEDSDHRTIIEPEFDDAAARAKRVSRLSEGEFEQMWSTAYMANKGGVADPKLARF